MAGQQAPSIAEVNLLIKSFKQQRKQLIRMVKSMPDQDAFAMPYSILIDSINEIEYVLKNFKASFKEAQMEAKCNPIQSPNRAKKWCYFNDSL